MRNVVIAAVIGAVLGAGIFLIWRAQQLPRPEKGEERIAAFPASEADLKMGEYFDLRGRKEVLISMQDGTFNPRIIIVDKGIKYSGKTRTWWTIPWPAIFFRIQILSC